MICPSIFVFLQDVNVRFECYCCRWQDSAAKVRTEGESFRYDVFFDF